MSQDWIKMRSCLWTHPKVIRLSDIFAKDTESWSWLSTEIGGDCLFDILRNSDITRYITLALLMRTWWFVNEHAEPIGEDSYDSVIYDFAPDSIDEIVNIVGFGKMLITVKFIKYDEFNNSTIFVNFLEHNAIEHSRSVTPGAIRQREYRARKKAERETESSVTNSVTRDGDSDATPSTSTSLSPSTSEPKKKERQPKTKPAALPPELDVPKFKAVWEVYLTHRREKKAVMTPTAISRLLVKLHAWGADRSVAALEHSVANGWTGVFEQDGAAPEPERVHNPISEPPRETNDG